MKTIPLSQPQLFLDDRWVEQCTFIERQWHQPIKWPKPVLTSENPWERWCPVLYGTVLKRDEQFQAWYSGWTRKPMPRICYAISDDGVHWEKPELGLHEWAGSDTNIVLQSETDDGLIDDITVIEDPTDTEWPLKALFFDGRFVGTDWIPGYGIYAARSKDGIHWDRFPGPVLSMWGDRFNAVSQRVDGKFILFGRKSGDDADKFSMRRVWRTESEDLLNWSEPELVLQPDNEDPAPMQFYSLCAYPHGDLLIGAVERMHMIPDRLDTEIVWSYDAGRTWQRSRSRPSFIEWGAPGSFDSTWINLPTNGPIKHENRLWFYYSGRSAAHGAQYPFNHGGMGLATMREDGYASLYAAAREGLVLTPTFEFPDATQLQVNMDARSELTSHHVNIDGELRVEIRDENNVPIEGFTWEDCAFLRKNSANSPNASVSVSWKDKEDLSELRGRKIKLAFCLRNCHLYSFSLVGSASLLLIVR